MKRILLVIPRVSSFQAFLNELGAELVARGVDVHLAADARALPGERPPLPPSVCFHNMRFPRGRSVRKHLIAARELAHLIREISPDLVHAHFSAAIFTTALSTLWRPHKGARPVLWGTYQGMVSPLAKRAGQRFLRAAEAFSLRRADASWVLTRDDMAFAAKIAPGTDVHMQQSPGFGCRTDLFSRSRIDATAVEKRRKELGLVGRPFTLVFAGRFTEFKGFALTVRAFLHLYRLHHDARLILAGEPDELHPTGLAPHEEVAMRECPGIVCPGFVADLQNILALCDVMVFPSRREGMPVCVMEALAMQIPVVTLNSRGCRELVHDEENGIVLPDDRVETLARVLCDLRDRRTSDNRNGFSLPLRPDLDRVVYVREQMELYCKCLGFPMLDRTESVATTN